MKILCIQLSPHVLPALCRGLSSSVGALILAQDRHWARAYCVYCTLHSKHHETSAACLPSFSPGSASSSAISGMMWSSAVASSTPPPTHSSSDSTTLCSRPLEPRTLLRHNFGAELCNFVTRWSPERDGGQAYQERHDSKDEDDENLGIEHVHGGCWWNADWEMSWCYV